MKKNVYGPLVKIAILCIIIVQYSITLTTPILGTIKAAYPGDEYTIWIKLLETAPTFAMIPTCLLLGPLLKIISRKHLLLAGTILACGQVLPFFFDGIWVILACRLISGLGMGICYPFAGSYILDLFDGEERDSMLGWRATVGAVAGIAIMQLSGILAAKYSYHASFAVAFICAILFVIMLLFIPDISFDEENPSADLSDTANDETRKRPYTAGTWLIILLNILVMLFGYTYMTNTSIVICASEEIGGLALTATSASMALTIMSGTMALSGLLYGKVFVRLFRNYITLFGVFMIGAGITVSLLSHNIWTIYLAAVLFGIGFQVYNAAILVDLSATTTPEAVAQATALYFAFNSIGQFLSSVVVPFMAKGLLGNYLRGDWLVSSICLMGGTLVVIIIKTISIKKQSKA